MWERWHPTEPLRKYSLTSRLEKVLFNSATQRWQVSHFTFQLSLLRERKKKSVNFHFEKSFLSINSSSSLSLISHSLIGSLNIRLVPERFILLLWSVTLAALHRGARIMRVVAGRQTVLTSQLRPSLSRLKKNVNTEALCFMDCLL